MAGRYDIAWLAIALAACHARSEPAPVCEPTAPVDREVEPRLQIVARAEVPPSRPLPVLPPSRRARDRIAPPTPTPTLTPALTPTPPPAVEPPAEPPLAITEAAPPSPAAARLHHHLATDDAPRRFGMMFDVGVPDGATAALLLRPIRAVRVDAGLSYNGISRGVRAGVTLVPLASWVSPTLSVDYGHYTEGDANPLARMVSGDPSFTSPVLDRIGYAYGDAQVGLELGRTRFTFYVRAGVTRVTGRVHDLASLVGGSMPKTTVTLASDPDLTITALAARVGFILYLGR